MFHDRTSGAGGSVARPLAFLVLLILSTGLSAAQTAWLRNYSDGVRHFERREFALAEEKLLAAINDRGAPPERGPNVNLVSQMPGGFIPEYYLALISQQAKKHDAALDFARRAKAYLPARDRRRAEMEAVETDATKALADLAEQTRKATLAGQFDSLMREAASELQESRLAPARDKATRARALGVNNDAADTLLADIARHEDHARHLAEASRARDAANYAQARASANLARATGVDVPGIDSLLAEITRLERAAGDRQALAAAIAEATRARDQRRWREAREAALRALALDSSNVPAAALLREIEAGERTSRIEDLVRRITPLLASGSAAAATPLADALAALDPAHDLVRRHRQMVLASLTADQTERFGAGQFLKGQYQAAVETLARLDGDRQPRARFYAACSKAALALMTPDADKRAALVAEARRDLGLIREPRRVFAADLRYVSPSIVQLLGL
jgi:hypothetical protein